MENGNRLHLKKIVFLLTLLLFTFLWLFVNMKLKSPMQPVDRELFVNATYFETNI